MRAFLVAAALLCAALSAAAQSAGPAPAPAALKPVLAHHARLVHASYEDVLASARTLQRAVQAFVARPDDAGLQAARSAWRAAREVYGQTEAYRFYGGPIDDARGPEGRLNAWSMDESFVDAVQGRPDAGLVNDRRVRIARRTLVAQNERGGEENIATGWHAIEFLLWGQDLSDDGPGARRADDFVDGRAPNADRRRQYLRVVADLLVDDLASLVRAWAPGAANYRARFERGDAES
ncbi:MAG TPA: imelysin family protein, partial [Methylibium sp.]|nr:imelysin family protein [Methylibium sp.]